eukprot:tig00020961_g16659.t2
MSYLPFPPDLRTHNPHNALTGNGVPAINFSTKAHLVHEMIHGGNGQAVSNLFGSALQQALASEPGKFQISTNVSPNRLDLEMQDIDVDTLAVAAEGAEEAGEGAVALEDAQEEVFVDDVLDSTFGIDI